jgi:hypothetical protein
MGATTIVKKTISATKKKFCSKRIKTVPIKVASSFILVKDKLINGYIFNIIKRSKEEIAKYKDSILCFLLLIILLLHLGHFKPVNLLKDSVLTNNPQL